MRVSLFAQIIVSTDSESIAEIARRYGADVPFLRGAALADDDTPVSAVTVDALEQVDPAGDKFTCGRAIDAEHAVTGRGRRRGQLSAVRHDASAGAALGGAIWLAASVVGDATSRRFPPASALPRRRGET